MNFRSTYPSKGFIPSISLTVYSWMIERISFNLSYSVKEELLLICISSIFYGIFSSSFDFLNST